jgi:hypothetical protein
MVTAWGGFSCGVVSLELDPIVKFPGGISRKSIPTLLV